MNAVEIIRKKRDGEPLTRDEIGYWISGTVSGEIPDYQTTALLMAIRLRGMDDRETADLTDIMANSGAKFEPGTFPGFSVDKHSTGGVGDTTTLVLIPLLAAAGLTIGKLSGRALGHTGGTIDKLESIPGFRTDLSKGEFLDLVKRHRLALADHTEDMVPADRILYELRDVTATVDSLPLIVASIMSKKIAGGAEGIVIDVKTGSGAFLPELDDVGNALEVMEAIDTMKGKGPDDLTSLCCELGAELLLFAGKSVDREGALERLHTLLQDGSALSKFEQLISNQGGNAAVIDDPSLLPRAARRVEARASTGGTIKGLDALSIGRAANLLGAGRTKKEDEIDPSVGIQLLHKVGDEVKDRETLAVLHVNAEENLDEALELVESAYDIDESGRPHRPPKLIVERIVG